jgi:hypothetical protein
MEGKGWKIFGPKKQGQRSAGKKIDCDRMLVNVGWKGGWKTQPILWTERPTGAVMEAGSLWPPHPTSCAQPTPKDMETATRLTNASHHGRGRIDYPQFETVRCGFFLSK